MRIIQVYESNLISRKDTKFLKEALEQSDFYKFVEFSEDYKKNLRAQNNYNEGKIVLMSTKLSKAMQCSSAQIVTCLKKSYLESYFAKKLAKVLNIDCEFKR